MNQAAPQPTGPTGHRQYLTFMLGRERYAMPTEHIREVIRFSSLTEVPMVPDFLRGVINLRGAVVPVIDLALRLGLPLTVHGKRTCVVILEFPRGAETMRIGVLVDVVHAVFDLASDQIGPPPAGSAPAAAHFTSGLLDLDGDAVIALDIARVLDLDELAELIGRACTGVAEPGAGREQASC